VQTAADGIFRSDGMSEVCELTILMPCLNEAETLASCISKARAFLARSGCTGEVLIADNGSTDRSQAIATRYDVGLSGLPLALPLRRPDTTHVFHQYVIRLDKRDQLRDRLRDAGIGTGIHYPGPVHAQPAYRGRLTPDPSGLGVTARAAPQILSLPMYPQLSDAAVERVIAEVRGFFA
jgi:hypothetical protein